MRISTGTGRSLSRFGHVRTGPVDVGPLLDDNADVGNWNFAEHGAWGNRGSGVRYAPFVQARYISQHNPLSLKQRVLMRSRVEDAAGYILEQIGTATGPKAAAQRVAQDLLNESKLNGSTAQEAQEYVQRALDQIEPGLAARASRKSIEMMQRGTATTYREATRDAVAFVLEDRWRRMQGTETDPRCAGGEISKPRTPPPQYAPTPTTPGPYTSQPVEPYLFRPRVPPPSISPMWPTGFGPPATAMPGQISSTPFSPAAIAQPTSSTPRLPALTAGGAKAYYSSTPTGPAKTTSTPISAARVVNAIAASLAKALSTTQPVAITLPGGGVKALSGLGYAQRSIAERAIGARLEGLSGLGASGGRPFVEWFADTFGRGRGAGARAASLFADWQCSPANTAIGAAITSIWTGPAGGAAAGSAATGIQQAAGCDIWARARRLANQEGLTRSQAIDLIQAGAWVEDARTRTWYKTASAQGLWVRFRPYAPYAAAGLGALFLVSRL